MASVSLKSNQQLRFSPTPSLTSIERGPIKLIPSMTSYFDIMEMLGHIVPDHRTNGQTYMRVQGTDIYFPEQDMAPIQECLVGLMRPTTQGMADADL